MVSQSSESSWDRKKNIMSSSVVYGLTFFFFNNEHKLHEPVSMAQVKKTHKQTHHNLLVMEVSRDFFFLSGLGSSYFGHMVCSSWREKRVLSGGQADMAGTNTSLRPIAKLMVMRKVRIRSMWELLNLDSLAARAYREAVDKKN